MSGSPDSALESACQQNKASLTRFVDLVWNQGALDVIDELIAADYVGHCPGESTPLLGPESVGRRVAKCRAAIPDLYVKIDDLIAEEDSVAMAWRAGGACADPTASRGRAPLRCVGLSVVRFLAGKQVESQTIWQRDGTRLEPPLARERASRKAKPNPGGQVWDSE